MSDTIFKLGSDVEAFGVRGKVVNDNFHALYPILVAFGAGRSMTFTRDGRGQTWHKEPALKLIKNPEPPKRKEKRRLQGWMNIYEHNRAIIFPKREMADYATEGGRITCIPIDLEYEVEVDE